MDRGDKYSWLRVRINELLNDIDGFIVDELGDICDWRAHELAPLRASINHAEWLLTEGKLAQFAC